MALAVEAIAPAYDNICLAIEAEPANADANVLGIAAHPEGLYKTKSAFETGLKALGLRLISPKSTPFDPVVHEALRMEETDKTKPGEMRVLHPPGLAQDQPLIRPAHATVSASPSEPKKKTRKTKRPEAAASETALAGF